MILGLSNDRTCAGAPLGSRLAKAARRSARGLREIDSPAGGRRDPLAPRVGG